MNFWDSSALVPLAVPEPQSAACSALYRHDSDVLVWALTPVEVLSALHRRQREGELSDEALALATASFDELRGKWSEVVDLEVVRPRAERLIAVHALRAADALQLAAALVACNEQPQQVPFVSLDHRLIDAARREGFKVLPESSDELTADADQSPFAG